VPGDLSSPVRVGDVVAGKFRIERFIGGGATGLVLEATHLQLDERVALKFLREEALGNREVVLRFAQEARAAVKLKSEHVAKVLDVGEHAGLPYMVLELLEGDDLERLVATRGPLPHDESVDLVIQACEGIAEAHARGIIHRDIKPANLFLAQRPGGWSTLKVLDFGISKLGLAGEGPTQTSTRSIVGSPYYMSPEQIRAPKDVDRRSDIWSLGTVLFELLTGEKAFASTDLANLIDEIRERGHKHLSSLRPDVPLELVAVVDRCLAKSAEDRFQSAGALALALLPFTTSKSARGTVSRAVTITRSSGVDSSLPLPSGLPPRPSLSDAFDAPAVAEPGRRESVTTAAAVAKPRTDTRAYASTTRTHADPDDEDILAPTAPPGRGGRPALFLVAALAVLGAALLAAALGTSRPGPTTSASATPTASATASGEARDASTAAAAAAPPGAPPSGRAAVPVDPRPTRTLPSATAPPHASAGSAPLEIRRER
jgi:serine/threonine-protein kinase